jgi:hypothetical protein
MLVFIVMLLGATLVLLVGLMSVLQDLLERSPYETPSIEERASAATDLRFPVSRRLTGEALPDGLVRRAASDVEPGEQPRSA